MAEATRAQQGVPGRSGGARRLRSLWHTTLGKKLVVALSGTVLAGYVVVHMLANLLVLRGPGTPGEEAPIDSYAEFLRGVFDPVVPREGLLWIFRAVLLAALIAHVVAIWQLWQRNRKAKPKEGARPTRIRSTFAARTMTFTGLLLLAFIVFHVLHFTTHTIHPTPLEEGAVYANTYTAFGEWWILALYVGGVGLLGFHLHHALWSAAQTTGLDNPYRNWFWRRLASAITFSVAIGFVLPPILIFAGALEAPT